MVSDPLGSMRGRNGSRGGCGGWGDAEGYGYAFVAGGPDFVGGDVMPCWGWGGGLWAQVSFPGV